ncbi:MAG: ATP-binding protein [Novosphingobium sp.]
MSAVLDLLSKVRFSTAQPLDAAEFAAESLRADAAADFGQPSPRAAPSPRDGSCVERVYRAFDVSQPVETADDLFGREAELRQLVDAVLHRRNHGFIAGQRGSGKTSLARAVGEKLDLEGAVVLYGACEDGASLGEIVRGFLEQLPASSLAAGTEAEFRRRVTDLPDQCTPAQANDLLALVRYSRLVIVLDEFDRVTEETIRHKLASLMKLASDARLPVRIVLIGDYPSFTAVGRAHPSLLRHISFVPVNPLDRNALLDLLRSCADRCGLRFAQDALDLLTDVVCGSPYHARLFGLHAALESARAGEAQIGVGHATAGVHRAFAEWTTLCPDEAESLRRIAGGGHGDPEPYIRLARDEAALTAQPARPGAAQAGGPIAPEMAALGSAVNATEPGARFRERTAPQFLIALAHVIAREPARNQQGQHADA